MLSYGIYIFQCIYTILDNSYYSGMVLGEYLLTIAQIQCLRDNLFMLPDLFETLQIQCLRDKAAFFIMSKLPKETTNCCCNILKLFDPRLVPFFVTLSRKTMPQLPASPLSPRGDYTHLSVGSNLGRKQQVSSVSASTPIIHRKSTRCCCCCCHEAKTYLEKHFADFESCDVDALIKHGMEAMCLDQW